MRKLVLICAFIIFASGCFSSEGVNWKSVKNINKNIEVTPDDENKTTSYKGPTYPGNISGSNIFLRALQSHIFDKEFYQIYIHSYYGGNLRDYEKAYDSDGNELECKLIDKGETSDETGGVFHNEHIALNITRAYLEEHRTTGVKFTIQGKGGKETFHLPATYITAFLKKTQKK